MTRILKALPIALALLGAPLQGAMAANSWGEPGSPRAASARDVYRDNLVGCISRASSCDRSRLSQEDRDYLTYEMRSQRFSPAVVDQVADVRMEIYGKPVRTVMGRSTGTRYAAPAAAAAAPPSEGASGASQIIGLTKGLAEVAGPLLKQMGGTATN